MRELKFRARDEDNKRWLYFTLLSISNGDAGLHPVGGDWDDTVDLYELKNWCQYTGLKDKNGKEIYEGDIIRDKNFWRPCVVEFIGSGFYLYQETRLVMPNAEYREVIGNIHENADLIGG